MLSVNWFLTLYITVLNHIDVISIIDCFFIDGSKVKFEWIVAHNLIDTVSNLNGIVHILIGLSFII